MTISSRLKIQLSESIVWVFVSLRNSVEQKSLDLSMAGMLPGVELARRRRACHDKHKLGVDSPLQRSHSRIQPSNMDETALRARRNLEQKLRSFSSSSKGKVNDDRPKENLCSESRLHPATPIQVLQGERGGGSKLERVSLEEEVCAVCLEVFQPRQQVMNLPCLHRYHTDCVIPWLTKHSHCPSCRSHVQV